MTESTHESHDATSGGYVQERWMELIVAAFFLVIAALVIKDSYRVGNNWVDGGPQPGYFTFYIGCILALGALFVAGQTILSWKKEGGQASFVGHHELKLVLSVFVPTVVYVAAVLMLGFYLSSILYIVGFMMWQGKYNWIKSLAVGGGVAAVLFALFELWFLVPLPKGPIEAMLGY